MPHTPGPWEARFGDTFNRDRSWGIVKPLSRQACLEIDGDLSGHGSRTEVIAEVFDRPDDRGESDARLMAAAPDLLAALKLCYRHALCVFPQHPEDQPCDGCRGWQLARDAIAKAEGRDV